MPRSCPPTPAGRKTPQRRRSLFTVDVLLDATIQVLGAHGPQALTTTRVARRAGVSVGAVYQYFDNRLALLYAAHRRHVVQVADALVGACAKLEGAPVAEMVRGVVRTYVAMKCAAADEARALCLVRAELDAADLVAPETLRVREAVRRMLASAADAQFADERAAAWMFVVAMAGPIRSALEDRVPAAALHHVGEQAILLCESYLRARAVRH